MEVRGPWNREMIDFFNASTGALLHELVGAPWGILAVVSEDGMHTPDSYAAMVEGIRRQRETGRCATAVILDQVFGEPMVRRVLAQMYRDAGEPATFFEDETSARAWLLAQISSPA